MASRATLALNSALNLRLVCFVITFSKIKKILTKPLAQNQGSITKRCIHATFFCYLFYILSFQSSFCILSKSPSTPLVAHSGSQSFLEPQFLNYRNTVYPPISFS